MTDLEKLKDDMVKEDVFFTFNGEQCSAYMEVDDSIPTFYIHYGDIVRKQYHDFYEMANDKVFDDQSLSDILDKIQIRFH